MSTSLFGLEAEMALSATRSNAAVPTDLLVMTFDQEARRTLAHLQSGVRRLFLGNGSLLYVDCGLHPELATPECTTPWEAVCHLRAGERLVERIARLAGDRLRADTMLVARSNVDYLSGTTWGCHESYLGRLPIGHYSDWLIPHLASRIVFTGSGGIDPLSPGIRLSLSPRVAHLDHVVSLESTGQRGIFHTRDEPLCSGYSRIHVLAGDNACSQRATWLKVGTTALVVALAEATPAQHSPVHLHDPVRAMQGFAHDLHHRARVRTGLLAGTRMSAAEIQRAFLERAEALAGSASLPDWAGEVCAQWRAALDLIESPAIHASHRFDWPLKFALMRREIARHGFTERRVLAWTEALEPMARHLPCDDPFGTQVQLDPAHIESMCRNNLLAGADRATGGDLLRAHGLSWQGLDTFNALRRQLCAIDLRFGAMEDGIFESLDRRGLIPEHRMVSEGDIVRAGTEPPQASRAAARGHWVKLLADRRQEFMCDWHCIAGKRTRLDLSDPLAPASRWKRVRNSPSAAPRDALLRRL